MSANNLQNGTQFEFIINAIKEIRSNNKHPDNQTIFHHITKTAAANMDHGQIDELISKILKNGLIYDTNHQKRYIILLWRQQITIMEKLVITQMSSVLEITIALLDVVTLHHHIKILIVQPRNLKLLQSFLHQK